ncbi:MAG: class I adenylate-forming enzyme family protein [Acidimicrobiia bacterium]
MTAPSLASLLIDHPFADSEPLLHGPETMLTAGEARAAARGVAARLTDAGVQPGHAVAVQMRDGPELITTMFGVWLAGAVFVPVNPRVPAPEVEKVLAATAPAVVVTGDGTEVRTRRDHPRDYGPEAAFVMWTSGTTGEPKPILHQHAAYFELLDRVLAPLRAKPRDPARPPSPNLIAVSISLNAGIYNVLFGLRAGAPIVVMDGFEPAVFAELVARFGIRSTVLPPAAMVMLTDDPAVVDISPIKYVRSITAPLSPVQAKRFTDKFRVTVLNGYGQAEIGEVIGWTAADAREHPEKIGAVGRAHPGVAIKLLDDADTVVSGADAVGRLLVRPPSMAAGYADGAELADRVDDEGFVDTGDLARVDSEGFVWIEGRAGDVINRGGNKVFPDHVAEVLRLVPGVTDAGVVGVPDDRLGSVPVAFIVGGAGVSDDDLRIRCREHLAPYKVPVTFHRVETLPRNQVGKLLRNDLVALHESLASEVP